MLGLAFDISWEMRLDETGEAKIELFQDAGVHLGFQPGEFPRTLTAREWIERMHHDDITSVDRAHDHVLKRQQIYQTEYRVRRVDGGYTWWEERGAPTEFRGGSAIAWLRVVRNVTERKQAELDLQRAVQELHELKGQHPTFSYAKARHHAAVLSGPVAR